MKTLTPKEVITINLQMMFELFVKGLITQTSLIKTLTRLSKRNVMYRFNKSTILYTTNEVINDLLICNSNNNDLLIELISDAVENNSIEVIF
jgi:hypothetical protein